MVPPIHMVHVINDRKNNKIETHRIGHEPDNLRVSSGWAKDCCDFLIPIDVHIVY